ncbi:Spy/CpxP family protein refolding chaperone [Pseudoduganella aquatica]|uniref:Periplasmic heavy metal sensor n=1 Tax=Pseudoduganella aquatica TaxID=2660641 RepID=A0A7X4KP36_9BURK|nr:Spy/CpxP family protein refolding chaperone [Pseudoduganella aquatica]MYN09883.1 periplasmic heavy metal sensor [Pseudoduganella aquatica]
MKTKKIHLQHLLLAAALALPLASHAANGLSSGDEGFDAPPPGPRAEGGPGMPPGGPGPGPRMGGRGGPDGERGPHGGPHFMHGLDLSEAQQDKVFTILHTQEPYIREQSRALRKAQEALDAMGKAEKFDDAKAVSLAQAAAQAISNMELQRVRTEQKLLGVLTPEQRKQLDQRKPPRQGFPAREKP